jgi:uncharacterized protein (TIGR02466 family)
MASMPLKSLFPTYVYGARLPTAGAAALNRQILKEGMQLRSDDAAGRRWSQENYPGGYTSYGSVHRLHRISPTFAALERKLARHVAAFAKAVEWDLRDRRLEMTDCWINFMPRQTVHSLHLHPSSTVSGSYYVRVPRGGPGIKFEDPRLDCYMAAPPKAADCRTENRTWVTLPVAAGRLVLFESWLRHEVVPNPAATERVSVSFNYHWFPAVE